MKLLISAWGKRAARSCRNRNLLYMLWACAVLFCLYISHTCSLGSTSVNGAGHCIWIHLLFKQLVTIHADERYHGSADNLNQQPLQMGLRRVEQLNPYRLTRKQLEAILYHVFTQSCSTRSWIKFKTGPVHERNISRIQITLKPVQFFRWSSTLASWRRFVTATRTMITFAVLCNSVTNSDAI